MKAEEAAEEFEDAWESRLRQIGSLSKASQEMGETRNHLWNHSQGGIRVRSALMGLAALGEALPEEPFNTAFHRLGTDPLLILESAREEQIFAPDLYFRGLRPRIAALVTAGADALPDWSSRQRKIAKLDKLRRRDRQLAREKLKQLLTGIVERLEERGERPKAAFGDLATALGVFAALQRLAGYRNDAMDLLQVARPLTLLVGTSYGIAGWWQKAAYLLVDLKRDSRAYEFLMQALKHYSLAGARAEQVRTLVDSAYVLTHAGLHQASLEVLAEAMPLLPGNDIEGRFSAHQYLASNLLALDDPNGANKQLELAIALVGDDLLARAACLCSRARLLIRLGDRAQAIPSFAEALPLYAKMGGAAELAEIAMEFATLLLEEGRRAELRALATDLSGWLKHLRGNRKLRDAIDNFTGYVALNTLNEKTLGLVRQDIAEAKAR